MAVRDIRLLGDPILRTPCSPVKTIRSDRSRGIAADLADTLRKFQNDRGFGRAIAAPQIGISQRVLYLDYDIRGPLYNPRIIRRSRSAIKLWDDCFSFPDLMVQVRRHTTVTVEYRDAEGRKRTVKATDGLSELLQHEIDHLDGILAIDRAVDLQHIMLRSEFERHALARRHIM
jgi:peptide deformylase